MTPGDAPASAPTRVPRKWAAARLWPLAFPILLWLTCTLYFPVRGRYQDDYSYGMRDPVTGAIDPAQGSWDLYPYFFRPLGFPVIRWLPTILWSHWWLYHVASALVHGAVALLLWRLMIRAGVPRLAAAAGALLFLAFPMHYEVTLWATSITISIAAAVLLCLAHMWLSFARAGTGRSWYWLAAMVALAFAVPCFYEQPGAGIGALPLLYLAVCPRDQAWRRRILRAGIAGAALLATQVLYIWLLSSTAPSRVRGGSSSLISSTDELASRLDFVAAALRGLWITRLGHTLRGAFAEGLSAVATLKGAAFLLGLGLFFWPWTRHLVLTAPAASQPERDASWRAAARTLWSVAFGIALALAAWAPLLLVKGQIAEPRMTYFGMLGLAWTFAALLGSVGPLARRLRCLTVLRAVACVLVGAAAIYSTVCCIGWQSLMRTRARADGDQAAQLLRLAPQPAPFTVFTPLRDDFRPARTGHSLVDSGLNSWTWISWIGSPLVRQTYRRHDLYTLGNSPWHSSPDLSDSSADGFRSATGIHRYPAERITHDPRGGISLRWSEVIPFTVDAEGRIRLIDRIWIERPDNDDLLVEPPLVAAQPGLPDARATWLSAVIEPPPEMAEFGPWNASGAPAAITRLFACGVSRRALRLHPLGAGGAYRSVAAPLGASGDETVVRFRAAGAPNPRILARPGPGPVLVFAVRTWETEEETEVLRFELSRNATDDGSRWTPITLRLPPAEQPRILVVRAEPSAAGLAEADGVYLTPGWTLRAPAGGSR
jgi:hypothetical protein